jgi:O-antigen/teichoic acid export membrane protein
MSSQLVSLLALVAVSHLMPPSAVGDAAIALLVTQLAVALSTFGFGARVVKEPTLDPVETGTAVLLSWIAGILAAVLTVVISETAVRSVFGAEIASLVRLAAPAFVFTAVAAVPMALLERRLAFRTISAIEASGFIAGAIVSVVLAVAGMNAPALVIGQLVSLAIIGGAVLIKAPVTAPRLGSPGRALRYGVPATMSGILYILFGNVDYALLGARIPATQVGYYVRAYQLGSDYQSKISGIMLRIALPVFARAANVTDLREIRMRITRVHATLLFPLLFVLIATAPTLVPFLLGHAWKDAALPTQVLAVGGMIGAVGTGLGPLLLAMDRAKAALLYNFVMLVTYGVAVWLSAPYGIVVVAVVGVTVRLLGLACLLRLVVQPLVGIPAMDTLTRDIAPATVSAIPLLAIDFIGSYLIRQWHLPTAPALVVIVSLSLVAYAIVLRRLFPSSWEDIMLLARIRRRPQTVSTIAA